MPLAWHWDPFRAAMRATVRPATARSRRKWHLVRMRVPMELVEKLMLPIADGAAEGLKRHQVLGRSKLEPTSCTVALNHYRWKVKNPVVSDLLFALETTDKVKHK